MFETLNTQINTLLGEIATNQAIYLETHDRHQQLFKTAGDDFDYEVHEYKTSEGDVGYKVILYKTDDDKEYIKTVGYGVDAESLTNDWREIINEDI